MFYSCPCNFRGKYETRKEGISPSHDPVTWYGMNYAGTETTQWDFQKKGTLTSPVWLSFREIAYAIRILYSADISNNNRKTLA